MTVAFFKINSKFSIHDDPDEDPVVCEYDPSDLLSLALSITDGTGVDIGFNLRQDQIVTGHFKVAENGDHLSVDCQAVFKVDVRPQHMDSVLNADSKWLCNGIGIGGVLSGDIIPEKYEYKNRFGSGEATRYYIKVKTGLKAKDVE